MTRSAVVRFAEETELHGVKEYFRSSNRVEIIWSSGWSSVVIWSCVLLFDLAYMVKVVAFVIVNYVDQKTVTHVSLFIPDFLPDFSFCFPYWISEKRI